jgi:hypothetical protein
MQSTQTGARPWHIELDSKPDFDQAVERIYAWYEQQMIDRPPVRFTRHNEEYEAADDVWLDSWRGLKDKWFDETYQIERFMLQVRGKRYLGETFPVYWPNLGPSIFAAYYGCPLEFGEVTSWTTPILDDYSKAVTLDRQNEYLLKIESLTRAALEMAPGRFIVGYTDMHAGLDWVAALRGTERLCLDLIDNPDPILPLIRQVTADFLQTWDHYDAILKAAGQPSITWMGIPSFGKLHIPSCDFASLISTPQFRDYSLPAIYEEVQPMTHNIFHVDGRGVARHLDLILELPNVQAIQWVQGVGRDQAIMQWVPLIRRIQAAGKSVVVDLDPSELEDFMAAVRPEGILLTMATDEEEQERAILKRVAKW